MFSILGQTDSFVCHNLSIESIVLFWFLENLVTLKVSTSNQYFDWYEERKFYNHIVVSRLLHDWYVSTRDWFTFFSSDFSTCCRCWNKISFFFFLFWKRCCVSPFHYIFFCKRRSYFKHKFNQYLSVCRPSTYNSMLLHFTLVNFNSKAKQQSKRSIPATINAEEEKKGIIEHDHVNMTRGMRREWEQQKKNCGERNYNSMTKETKWEREGLFLKEFDFHSVNLEWKLCRWRIPYFYSKCQPRSVMIS